MVVPRLVTREEGVVLPEPAEGLLSLTEVKAIPGTLTLARLSGHLPQIARKVFISHHWTWQAVSAGGGVVSRPYACHAGCWARHGQDCGLPNWATGWSVGKKSWCCSHEQLGCPGYHYGGGGGGHTHTVVTTHVVSGGGGGSFGAAYTFHGHPPSAAGSGMMWHWATSGGTGHWVQVHTHGGLAFDCFAGITVQTLSRTSRTGFCGWRLRPILN
ncbi:unnamed protein product [Symbiodinium natans]|uniref:Uncharacterized protein n=1 Tax=Symbiodinium natans TaxID=878477 RepID=A0A812RSV3_9DINO|nr:unnamed protein product [Symbiodinium natans]